MNKRLLAGVVSGLVVLSGLGGYILYKKVMAPKQPLPAQFKVRLPSGEVVTAYKITQAPAVSKIPSGTRIAVEGRIVKETDDIGSTQLVLVSDAGKRFILLNAPFMRTLEQKALKKKAKLKGITVEKTSFKNYPALYIEDIVEIKE